MALPESVTVLLLIISTAGFAADESHDQLRGDVSLEQVVLAVAVLSSRQGSDLEGRTSVRIGYAIYVLNVNDHVDFNTKRRGDCRLEIRFGMALPESVTVLMYGKFPGSYTWINPAVSCYNEQFGSNAIQEANTDRF
jgi:hypothetical protein